MKAIAEKETYKGHEIVVYYDMEPVNPREEYENHLGKMYCVHRRYNLGDLTFSSTGDLLTQMLLDYGEPPDTQSGKYWELWNYGAVSSDLDLVLSYLDRFAFYLPLYLYDHSGITMNTTGFSCPWDSGQVGYIITSKERVREEWKVKRISPKLRKLVYTALKLEVEEYDHFLRGEMYCYDIPSLGDACSGFLSVKAALDAAKEVIDYELKEEQK